MGFFGSRAKPGAEVETRALPAQNESYEDIPTLPTPPTSTVIAEGVTVSGKLSGEGVIQVEGTVEGEIELKGAVIVTTTGRVHGPIAADVIHVAGSVEGSVAARDHLRLEKTGTLEGDAETVSLVVEDGGRLNGRTTMVKPDAAPPQRPKDNLQFGANYKAEEEGGE